MSGLRDRRSWPLLLVLTLAFGALLLAYSAGERISAQEGAPLSTVPPMPTPALESMPVAVPEAAEIAEAEGILSMIHVDDFENGIYAQHFILSREGSDPLVLSIDPALFTAQRGVRAYDGKRVRVTFAAVDAAAGSAGETRVLSLALVPEEVAPASKPPLDEVAANSAEETEDPFAGMFDDAAGGDTRELLPDGEIADGEITDGEITDTALAPTTALAPDIAEAKTLRFANLLCYFPDGTDRVAPPADIAAWSTGGVGHFDHYYNQISYGQLRLHFTTATQWRTMPFGYASLGSATSWVIRMGEECPNLFANAIDFDQYDGIQIFTNGNAQFEGVASWSAPVRYKGKTRYMPIAVYPYNRFNYLHYVVMHELGHAIGQLHSNNYDGDSNPYDNYWDVMSTSNFGADSDDPCSTFGVIGVLNRPNCIADGMIAFHRLEQDWIAPRRIFTLTAGMDQVVQLDWLALGATSANPVVIKIPIDGGDFFTVEARTNRTSSYDRMLPGSGVLIHEVLHVRSEPAWQVGATSDEESLRGGGVWLPGETYANDRWKFSIQILEQTDSGYKVRVQHNGAPVVWNPDLVLQPDSLGGTNWQDDLKFQVINYGGTARNLQLKIAYTTSPYPSFDAPTAAARLLPISARGMTCTEGVTVICKLSDLGARRVRDISLSLRATEAAIYNMTMTLSATGFTPASEDYFFEHASYLIARPDIAVQITPPTITLLNRQGTAQVLLRNTGLTLPDGSFTIALPAGLSVSGPLQPQLARMQAQCAATGSTIRCTGGSMPHGAMLRLPLKLNSTDANGRFALVAEAETTYKADFYLEDELNSANNRAQSLLCAGFCTPQGAHSSTIFLPSVRRR